VSAAVLDELIAKAREDADDAVYALADCTERYVHAVAVGTDDEGAAWRELVEVVRRSDRAGNHLACLIAAQETATLRGQRDATPAPIGDRIVWARSDLQVQLRADDEPPLVHMQVFGDLGNGRELVFSCTMSPAEARGLGANLGRTADVAGRDQR
jgi:hypothetical protein